MGNVSKVQRNTGTLFVCLFVLSFLFCLASKQKIYVVSCIHLFILSFFPVSSGTQTEDFRSESEVSVGHWRWLCFLDFGPNIHTGD